MRCSCQYGRHIHQNLDTNALFVNREYLSVRSICCVFSFKNLHAECKRPTENIIWQPGRSGKIFRIASYKRFVLHASLCIYKMSSYKKCVNQRDFDVSSNILIAYASKHINLIFLKPEHCCGSTRVKPSLQIHWYPLDVF